MPALVGEQDEALDAPDRVAREQQQRVCEDGSRDGDYLHGEGLDLVMHMVELGVVCEEELGGEAEYEGRIEARLALDFRRFVVERAEMVDYDVEIALGDVLPFVLRAGG